uniref:Mop domain-containing protein n=1 Tax=Panagrellus redivivus TaxID=6233 RepID=A0A7E4VXW5_PANRE
MTGDDRDRRAADGTCHAQIGAHGDQAQMASKECAVAMAAGGGGRRHTFHSGRCRACLNFGKERALRRGRGITTACLSVPAHRIHIHPSVGINNFLARMATPGHLISIHIADSAGFSLLRASSASLRTADMADVQVGPILGSYQAVLYVPLPLT